jgi:heme-degrading monooxygenase HmoA
MFTAIYRWRLKPGREDHFIEGWTRVTTAIYADCGSYGSRLHKCADGTWLAYAQWPDAATREGCHHSEQEGRRLMSEAVAEDLDPFLAEVVLDMLKDGPR